MSNEVTNSRPIGRLLLFGCGGTGINIVRGFEPTRNESHPGAAVITPVYVDTSRSNIPSSLSDEHCYVIERRSDTGAEIDGGGKVRSLNGDELVDQVKPLLNRFEPQDLNVVVFSTSGGTGSVAGLAIMAELIRRGHSVVGLAVGSVASAKEVANGVATFKTADHLARNELNAPLVLLYDQNDAAKPRTDVDQVIRTAIGSLAVLASRRNEELDRQDIFHTLRPDRALPFEARVLTLDLFRNNKDLEEAAASGATYISLASLYDSQSAQPTTVAPAYGAVGYLPRDLLANQSNEQLNGKDPMTFHFGVRTDEFNPIYQQLKSKKEEFDRIVNAAPAAKTLLDGSERAAKGGMIYD